MRSILRRAVAAAILTAAPAAAQQLTPEEARIVAYVDEAVDFLEDMSTSTAGR